MDYDGFYYKERYENPYGNEIWYVLYYKNMNIHKRFADVLNVSYEKISRIMKKHNGKAMESYKRSGTPYYFDKKEDAENVCQELNNILIIKKLKGEL